MTCPWCDTPVHEGETSVEYKGDLYHQGCLGDMVRDRLEVDAWGELE